MVFLLPLLPPLLAIAPAALAAPGEWLLNGNFESAKPAEGWDGPHVFGAPPEIRLDAAVRHEGKQSLRISAREAADAAFGQNLELPAGRLFELRGWVRTLDLAPERGTGLSGSLLVHRPDGGLAGSRAGKNRTGTTDWSEEVIVFRVPDDGRVRVSIFLAGFGKGTGTVWFDDLRLVGFPPASFETLAITRNRLSARPISPFLCAQFVEFLCDLVPGMHAELLSDGGFEGNPPYQFQYLGKSDDRRREWRTVVKGVGAEITRDRDRPFNGPVCLKIHLPAGPTEAAAAEQDGIHFPKGEVLRLRLWLRGAALDPAAEPAVASKASLRAAAAEGGKVLAEGDLGPAGKEWSAHDVLLHPAAASREATLSIEVRSPGTLWLDRVSLISTTAAPGGWRRDVVQALRDLHPGMIRLGGTAIESYEWEGGVGEKDRRVPFTTIWGGLEPNNVGLDEFISLCRQVDAEPLICVRWTGKSPKEAADEVEYLNGPTESPGGKKRAANGRREAYRVRYFQIGNEIGGKEYEQSVRPFAEAMRRVDPTIRILSSYPSEGVLASAAPLLDFISPHHYGCADLEGKEKDLLELRDLIGRLGGGREIRLAVTEWNTTAGDWGPARGALLTLDNALKCSRYHNLLQRRADLVEIAIRSNLANSFCSGIIQTRGPDLFLAPTYHAERLYARSGGDEPIDLTAALPPGKDFLDVGATLGRSGKLLRLYAVNDSIRPAERRIALKALGPVSGKARSFLLRDRKDPPERTAANSVAEPDRVGVVETEFAIPGAELLWSFPPLSVSLIEVPIVP